MTQTRAQLLKGFSNTSAPDDAVTVDSSGRVLVATTTSNANAGADDLQIGDRTASTERGITIGSTAGGGIRFADAGSTNAGIVEYQHSSNNLRFYTDATERVQITGNGTIKLISSGGIDFSGIQTNTAGMTSETLDSYEEGTWTPTLVSSGGTLTVSYNSNNGKYTKIGNVCQISFQMRVSSHSGGSGEYRVSGLPFSSSTANNDHIGVSTAALENHPIGSTEQLIQVIDNNSTLIRMLAARNNAGWNSYTPSSQFGIWMSFTYPIG